MSFEMSPGDPFYGFLIWVVLFVVAGIFVAQWLSRRQGLRSEGWRPQEALLKEIEIDYRSDGDGGQEFQPKIRYEYRVGARTYSSRRFSYRWPWTSDYSEASSHFVGLVAGSTFTVYVSPSRPSQSVVEGCWCTTHCDGV